MIQSLESEKEFKNQKIVQDKVKNLGNRFFEKAGKKVNKTTLNTLSEIWEELEVSNVKRKKLIHDISDSKTMEITEKLSEIKRTSKKLIENSKSQIKRVKTDHYNLRNKKQSLTQMALDLIPMRALRT